MTDQFFNQMQLPSRGSKRQYNGTGFTIDNGRLKNMKPDEDYFYSNASIDPNQLRQTYNPTRALPDDFANGQLYDNIVLDHGAYVSEYTDTKIQADINFKSYRDRFNILNDMKESS